MINKLMIANRDENAARFMRTAAEMGRDAGSCLGG